MSTARCIVLVHLPETWLSANFFDAAAYSTAAAVDGPQLDPRRFGTAALSLALVDRPAARPSSPTTTAAAAAAAASHCWSMLDGVADAAAGLTRVEGGDRRLISPRQWQHGRHSYAGFAETLNLGDGATAADRLRLRVCWHAPDGTDTTSAVELPLHFHSVPSSADGGGGETLQAACIGVAVSASSNGDSGSALYGRSMLTDYNELGDSAFHALFRFLWTESTPYLCRYIFPESDFTPAVNDDTVNRRLEAVEEWTRAVLDSSGVASASTVGYNGRNSQVNHNRGGKRGKAVAQARIFSLSKMQGRTAINIGKLPPETLDSGGISICRQTHQVSLQHSACADGAFTFEELLVCVCLHLSLSNESFTTRDKNGKPTPRDTLTYSPLSFEHVAPEIFRDGALLPLRQQLEKLIRGAGSQRNTPLQRYARFLSSLAEATLLNGNLVTAAEKPDTPKTPPTWAPWVADFVRWAGHWRLQSAHSVPSEDQLVEFPLRPFAERVVLHAHHVDGQTAEKCVVSIHSLFRSLSRAVALQLEEEGRSDLRGVANRLHTSVAITHLQLLTKHLLRAPSTGRPFSPDERRAQLARELAHYLPVVSRDSACRNKLLVHFMQCCRHTAEGSQPVIAGTPEDVELFQFLLSKLADAALCTRAEHLAACVELYHMFTHPAPHPVAALDALISPSGNLILVLDAAPRVGAAAARAVCHMLESLSGLLQDASFSALKEYHGGAAAGQSAAYQHLDRWCADLRAACDYWQGQQRQGEDATTAALASLVESVMRFLPTTADTDDELLWRLDASVKLDVSASGTDAAEAGFTSVWLEQDAAFWKKACTPTPANSVSIDSSLSELTNTFSTAWRRSHHRDTQAPSDYARSKWLANVAPYLLAFRWQLQSARILTSASDRNHHRDGGEQDSEPTTAAVTGTDGAVDAARVAAQDDALRKMLERLIEFVPSEKEARLEADMVWDLCGTRAGLQLYAEMLAECRRVAQPSPDGAYRPDTDCEQHVRLCRMALSMSEVMRTFTAKVKEGRGIRVVDAGTAHDSLSVVTHRLLPLLCTQLHTLNTVARDASELQSLVDAWHRNTSESVRRCQALEKSIQSVCELLATSTAKYRRLSFNTSASAAAAVAAVSRIVASLRSVLQKNFAFLPKTGDMEPQEAKTLSDALTGHTLAEYIEELTGWREHPMSLALVTACSSGVSTAADTSADIDLCKQCVTVIDAVVRQMAHKLRSYCAEQGGTPNCNMPLDDFVLLYGTDARYTVQPVSGGDPDAPTEERAAAAVRDWDEQKSKRSRLFNGERNHAKLLLRALAHDAADASPLLPRVRASGDAASSELEQCGEALYRGAEATAELLSYKADIEGIIGKVVTEKPSALRAFADKQNKFVEALASLEKNNGDTRRSILAISTHEGVSDVLQDLRGICVGAFATFNRDDILRIVDSERVLESLRGEEGLMGEMDAAFNSHCLNIVRGVKPMAVTSADREPTRRSNRDSSPQPSGGLAAALQEMLQNEGSNDASAVEAYASAQEFERTSPSAAPISLMALRVQDVPAFLERARSFSDSLAHVGKDPMQIQVHLSDNREKWRAVNQSSRIMQDWALSSTEGAASHETEFDEGHFGISFTREGEASDGHTAVMHYWWQKVGEQAPQRLCDKNLREIARHLRQNGVSAQRPRAPQGPASLPTLVKDLSADERSELFLWVFTHLETQCETLTLLHDACADSVENLQRPRVPLTSLEEDGRRMKEELVRWKSKVALMHSVYPELTFFSPDQTAQCRAIIVDNGASGAAVSMLRPVLETLFPRNTSEASLAEFWRQRIAAFAPCANDEEQQRQRQRQRQDRADAPAQDAAVPWMVTLSAILRDFLAHCHFPQKVAVPVPVYGAQGPPRLESVRFRFGSILDNSGQPLDRGNHDCLWLDCSAHCPKLDSSTMAVTPLCLALNIYHENRQRAPFFHEMLVCTTETTTSDLDVFFHRWNVFSHEVPSDITTAGGRVIKPLPYKRDSADGSGLPLFTLLGYENLSPEGCYTVSDHILRAEQRWQRTHVGGLPSLVVITNAAPSAKVNATATDWTAYVMHVKLGKMALDDACKSALRDMGSRTNTLAGLTVYADSGYGGGDYDAVAATAAGSTGHGLQRYLHVVLRTETELARALLAADEPLRTGEKCTIRIDVDSFSADPQLVNSAMFSILFFGRLDARGARPYPLGAPRNSVQLVYYSPPPKESCLWSHFGPGIKETPEECLEREARTRSFLIAEELPTSRQPWLWTRIPNLEATPLPAKELPLHRLEPVAVPSGVGEDASDTTGASAHNGLGTGSRFCDLRWVDNTPAAAAILALQMLVAYEGGLIGKPPARLSREALAAYQQPTGNANADAAKKMQALLECGTKDAKRYNLVHDIIKNQAGAENLELCAAAIVHIFTETTAVLAALVNAWNMRTDGGDHDDEDAAVRQERLLDLMSRTVQFALQRHVPALAELNRANFRMASYSVLPPRTAAQPVYRLTADGGLSWLAVEELLTNPAAPAPDPSDPLRRVYDYVPSDKWDPADEEKLLQTEFNTGGARLAELLCSHASDAAAEAEVQAPEQDKSHPFLYLPSQVPTLVALRRCHRGGGGRHSLAILAGPLGCGKSRIAAQYARLCGLPAVTITPTSACSDAELRDRIARAATAAASAAGGKDGEDETRELVVILDKLNHTSVLWSLRQLLISGAFDARFGGRRICLRFIALVATPTSRVALASAQRISGAFSPFLVFMRSPSDVLLPDHVWNGLDGPVKPPSLLDGEVPDVERYLQEDWILAGQALAHHLEQPPPVEMAPPANDDHVDKHVQRPARSLLKREERDSGVQAAVQVLERLMKCDKEPHGSRSARAIQFGHMLPFIMYLIRKSPREDKLGMMPRSLRLAVETVYVASVANDDATATTADSTEKEREEEAEKLRKRQRDWRSVSLSTSYLSSWSTEQVCREEMGALIALPSTVDRNSVIERICVALIGSLYNKNFDTPLIIGPPGVGKTLALKLLQNATTQVQCAFTDREGARALGVLSMLSPLYPVYVQCTPNTSVEQLREMGLRVFERQRQGRGQVVLLIDEGGRLTQRESVRFLRELAEYGVRVGDVYHRIHMVVVSNTRLDEETMMAFYQVNCLTLTQEEVAEMLATITDEDKRKTKKLWYNFSTVFQSISADRGAVYKPSLTPGMSQEQITHRDKSALAATRRVLCDFFGKKVEDVEPHLFFLTLLLNLGLAGDSTAQWVAFLAHVLVPACCRAGAEHPLLCARLASWRSVREADSNAPIVNLCEYCYRRRERLGLKGAVNARWEQLACNEMVECATLAGKGEADKRRFETPARFVYTPSQLTLERLPSVFRGACGGGDDPSPRLNVCDFCKQLLVRLGLQKEGDFQPIDPSCADASGTDSDDEAHASPPCQVFAWCGGDSAPAMAPQFSVLSLAEFRLFSVPVRKEPKDKVHARLRHLHLVMDPAHSGVIMPCVLRAEERVREAAETLRLPSPPKRSWTEMWSNTADTTCISELRRSISLPRCVMSHGACATYHYLNDVLNGAYAEDSEGQYHSLVNNNGATEMLIVHDGFLYISSDARGAFEQMEGPMRGRFIKLHLRLSDVLPADLLRGVREYWAHYARDAETPAPSSADKNFLSQVIPGFGETTLLSLAVAYPDLQKALVSVARARGAGADTDADTDSDAAGARRRVSKLLHPLVLPRLYGISGRQRPDVIQDFQNDEVMTAKDDLVSGWRCYGDGHRDALVFVSQRYVPSFASNALPLEVLLARAWRDALGLPQQDHLQPALDVTHAPPSLIQRTLADVVQTDQHAVVFFADGQISAQQRASLLSLLSAAPRDVHVAVIVLASEAGGDEWTLNASPASDLNASPASDLNASPASDLDASPARDWAVFALDTIRGSADDSHKDPRFTLATDTFVPLKLQELKLLTCAPRTSTSASAYEQQKVRILGTDPEESVRRILLAKAPQVAQALAQVSAAGSSVMDFVPAVTHMLQRDPPSHIGQTVVRTITEKIQKQPLVASALIDVTRRLLPSMATITEAVRTALERLVVNTALVMLAPLVTLPEELGLAAGDAFVDDAFLGVMLDGVATESGLTHLLRYPPEVVLGAAGIRQYRSAFVRRAASARAIAGARREAQLIPPRTLFSHALYRAVQQCNRQGPHFKSQTAEAAVLAQLRRVVGSHLQNFFSDVVLFVVETDMYLNAQEGNYPRSVRTAVELAALLLLGGPDVESSVADWLFGVCNELPPFASELLTVFKAASISRHHLPPSEIADSDEPTNSIELARSKKSVWKDIHELRRDILQNGLSAVLCLPGEPQRRVRPSAQELAQLASYGEQLTTVRPTPNGPERQVPVTMVLASHAVWPAEMAGAAQAQEELSVFLRAVENLDAFRQWLEDGSQPPNPPARETPQRRALRAALPTIVAYLLREPSSDRSYGEWLQECLLPLMSAALRLAMPAVFHELLTHRILLCTANPASPVPVDRIADCLRDACPGLRLGSQSAVSLLQTFCAALPRVADTHSLEESASLVRGRRRGDALAWCLLLALHHRNLQALSQAMDNPKADRGETKRVLEDSFNRSCQLQDVWDLDFNDGVDKTAAEGVEMWEFTAGPLLSFLRAATCEGDDVLQVVPMVGHNTAIAYPVLAPVLQVQGAECERALFKETFLSQGERFSDDEVLVLRVCVEYLQNNLPGAKTDDGVLKSSNAQWKPAKFDARGIAVPEDLQKFCVGYALWAQEQRRDGFGGDNWSDEAFTNAGVMCLYLLSGEQPASVKDGYLRSVLQSRTVPQLTLSNILGEGTRKNEQKIQQGQADRQAVRALIALAALAASLIKWGGAPSVPVSAQVLSHHDGNAIIDVAPHVGLPICPRCHQPFSSFSGCLAVTCSPKCGAGFCGACFTDCGSDAHPHVAGCNVVAKRTTFFVNGDVWARFFTKEYISKRLDAIAAGGGDVAFPNHHKFIPPTYQRHLQMLRRNQHVVRLHSFMATRPSELMTAELDYDVDPVRLDDARISFAALGFALDELGDALPRDPARPRAPPIAALLKTLMALASTAGCRAATTEADLFQRVAGQKREITNRGSTLWSFINDLASEAAAEEQNYKRMLRRENQFQARVDAHVAERHRQRDPTAFYPALFASQLVSASGAAAWVEAAQRRGEAFHEERYADDLARRHSFTPNAAVNTVFYAAFAKDAHALVREQLHSMREIEERTLLWLHQRDAVLFPLRRINDFRDFAREDAARLGLDDAARCANVELNYASLQQDNEEGALRDALRIGDTSLVELLLTGAKKTSPPNPRLVEAAYGNESHGQVAGRPLVDANAFMVQVPLQSPVDLLHADKEWTRLAWRLHGTPDAAAGEAPGRHLEAAMRLADGSAGLLGRAAIALPPHFEFQATAISAISGAISECIPRVVAPVLERVRTHADFISLVDTLSRQKDFHAVSLSALHKFLVQYVYQQSSVVQAYFDRDGDGVALPPFETADANFLDGEQREGLELCSGNNPALLPVLLIDSLEPQVLAERYRHGAAAVSPGGQAVSPTAAAHVEREREEVDWREAVVSDVLDSLQRHTKVEAELIYLELQEAVADVDGAVLVPFPSLPVREWSADQFAGGCRAVCDAQQPTILLLPFFERDHFTLLVLTPGDGHVIFFDSMRSPVAAKAAGRNERDEFLVEVVNKLNEILPLRGRGWRATRDTKCPLQTADSPHDSNTCGLHVINNAREVLAAAAAAAAEQQSEKGNNKKRGKSEKAKNTGGGWFESIIATMFGTKDGARTQPLKRADLRRKWTEKKIREKLGDVHWMTQRPGAAGDFGIPAPPAAAAAAAEEARARDMVAPPAAAVAQAALVTAPLTEEEQSKLQSVQRAIQELLNKCCDLGGEAAASGASDREEKAARLHSLRRWCALTALTADSEQLEEFKAPHAHAEEPAPGAPAAAAREEVMLGLTPYIDSPLLSRIPESMTFLNSIPLRCIGLLLQQIDLRAKELRGS